MKQMRLVLLVAVLVVGLVACEAAKSSNPLSPSVAGPIPGVNITAPKPLEPGQGWQVDSTTQPVTLLIENAGSSGVRPLNLLVEMATDAGFETKVYTREGLAPGSDGRTSLRLPDPLASDRTYFWRVRAQDGANTGPYSNAVSFYIFTPIAVFAPAPVSPVGGQTLSGRRVTFVLRNAARSGPAGQMHYTFQLATNDAFGDLAAQLDVVEQANQTQAALDMDLAYATTYFWRARGYESNKLTIGPWSSTASFKTGAAPPPPPTPIPGPPPASVCGSGDALVRFIASIYPSRTAAVGSLSERQANMAFLRDRLIEAGICCGMDLGRNFKRCGSEISWDFLDQRYSDGTVVGIDIAMDYDNYGIPLQMYWGDTGPAPGVICMQPYSPTPSCK